MLSWLRIGFLAVLGIALLVVAFANITPVTVRLLPPDMAAMIGRDDSIDLPLFLVIFAGILAGLGIGFLWEWLRESKHRSRAATGQREVARLSREVERLRGSAGQPGDDVLALLEGRDPPR